MRRRYAGPLSALRLAYRYQRPGRPRLVGKDPQPAGGNSMLVKQSVNSDRYLPTGPAATLSEESARTELGQLVEQYNALQREVPFELVVDKSAIGRMRKQLTELQARAEIALRTAIEREEAEDDRAVLANLLEQIGQRHQVVANLELLQQLPGAVTPKRLHFYWSGKQIRVNARDNILAWARLAVPAGWQVTVWTDEVRQDWSWWTQILFNRADVKFGILNEKVIDPKLWSGYKTIGRAENANYPAASDLARYSVLKLYGGVYLDVDVAPGELTDMNRLVTWVRLPLLAPEIRDMDGVRDHLGLGPDVIPTSEQIKQTGIERLARGIHNGNFIVSPRQSPVIDAVIAQVLEEFAKHKKGAREVVDSPESAAFITGPVPLKRAITLYVERTLKVDRFRATDIVELALNHNLSLGWVTPESEEQEH
jgi:hypothetical protein